MNDLQALNLGISPCPNDTFIFGGLLTDQVIPIGFTLKESYLEDVETLNLWALESKLDITKISFNTLGNVLDEYTLLSTGCALGRKCGPLLVQNKKSIDIDISDQTIAIPGKNTTAALLMKMCYPLCEKYVEMRFDEIMPAIESGKIDAGVIIHESRFTYQNHGLYLVKDLGDWWEESTGHPIPLGGIVARRSFGVDLLQEIEYAICKSMKWAFENTIKSNQYIKENAQEMDEKVIADHINLYVNDYTAELGKRGKASVMEFLKRGNELGAFSANLENVFVTT